MYINSIEKLYMSKKCKYQNVFITCPKFNKKYSILDKIGDGHSSNVFKVISKTTQKEFAVKAYNHRNRLGEYNKIKII